MHPPAENIPFHQQVSKHFHRAADRYDQHADIQKQVAAQVAELAMHYLPEHALILDAGCGTGALAKLLPDYHIIALDRAEAMCRHAVRFPNAIPLCADMVAIPLKQVSIGGYISSLSWQWLDKPDLAITELKRILSRNGMAIIATLMEGTLRELDEGYASLQLEPRQPVFLAPECLEAGFAREGLTILSHKYVEYRPSYPSAYQFFSHLKAIGATASRATHPLSRLQLKRLMRYYDAHFHLDSGVYASYVVHYWILHHVA